MSPATRTRRQTGAGRRTRPRGAGDHGWLDLLTTSGPFLTLPVAQRVFPDGLPAVPTGQRAQLRAQVASMLDTRGAGRHQVIRTLLADVLGWRELLLLDDQVPDALAEPVVEHGVTVRPDLALAAPPDVADETDVVGGEVAEGADGADETDEVEGDAAAAGSSPYRLLGLVTAWGQHPLERRSTDGWSASPVERLAVLLRARDVPIGLVTDGRWWALVWAPRGGTTGAAVWDAGLFGEDPDSLRAFVALLRRSRFLAVAPGDTLPAMLQESQGAQEDVTVTLGRQVRDAVELLVRTVDRLDADSDGELLADVDDDDLYAGVVTVLMRVVFLLFAEDRRLLPSDDDLYLDGYSVSRLVDRLEQEAQLAGEQALEHRTGAWHRLLATTRALHGGVRHEDLRLPPYGGSLFDPEAHPWLERATGVDDRTVLRMLLAVQYVEIGGERRRLTFRALDVEQIGYVYEGLLETEVRTADEPVLALQRPPKWPKGKEPAEVPVSLVETWMADSNPLGARLKDRVDKPASRVETLLASAVDDERRVSLHRALSTVDLSHDQCDLVVHLAPVLHWYGDGTPGVVPAGRRYVAPSSRRASTGTHYTPRSLAEEVVVGALEPLVYRPGPIETSDRSVWRLRPSTEITALRVADIAMGSGAFLVAACRYLADRVVEAWQAEGQPEAAKYAAGSAVSAEVRADAEADPVVLAARQVVAERCLYGVDINPLAVEMAKLSLWLVTMDSRRPFGFLDDRLVAGDSLLGVVDVEQLEVLHIDPSSERRQRDLGAIDLSADWLDRLRQAADLRRRITALPANDKRDVERKAALLEEAERTTDYVAAVADRLTGVGLRVAGLPKAKSDNAFTALQIEVGLGGTDAAELRAAAAHDLQLGLPAGKDERAPVHWPVAFPEVLVDTPAPGFDAIVGNPPFLGGQKLSGALGREYLAWLQRWDGRGCKGSADLSARFVLRIHRLLSSRGQMGIIANNTLVQGDTLEVGLAQTDRRGLSVRAGQTSHKWPSKSANLEIVEVWATRAPLTTASQRVLDGEDVPHIGPDLEPIGRVAGRPFRLRENEDVAFIGSYVLGTGFTMTGERAQELIDADRRNAECLQPYVIGQDLNQRPDHSASRWIINFRDWPESRAAQYPELLSIIRDNVKPERDRNKEPRTRDQWWLYTRARGELYTAIADLDHVLALSLVSNVVLPVRVPTGPVFAHKCCVFALDSFGDLAVLSSSAHQVWVIRYSSTMRTDINYSPSDVFLTLPRPANTPELEALGERLDTRRRELMLSRSWGLTTTYNAVHNPAVTDAEVVQLRAIHRDIDHAVLAAYGWDLDPQVGHHPTKIGTRWTVSREARFELLDLLLEENHRRHAAENP